MFAYPACLASSLDIREKISATTGLVFCSINRNAHQVTFPVCHIHINLAIVLINWKGFSIGMELWSFGWK